MEAAPAKRSFSGMGCNVELTVLPMTVRCATLQMEALPTIFYSLMKLMFFTTVDSPERFFQCSVTDCLRLVASAAELALFPSDLLELDDTEWSVVQVSEGADGFAEVGVVERITGPLARASVPVLYVSTFSQDYVLIPPDRLDDALRHLRQLDPDGVEVHCAENPTRQRPDADADAAGAALARVALASDGGPAAGVAGSPPAPSCLRREASVVGTHPLTVLSDGATHMCRIDKASLPTHMGTLVRLLFMPHAGDPPHALRAWTETPDEISVVHGTADWFAEYAQRAALAANSQRHIAIRIGDDAGCTLAEVGVVAAHANVLRAAEIPTLYHCTFAKPLVLVPEELLPQAIGAFRDSGAQVRCSDAWVTEGSTPCPSPALSPAAPPKAPPPASMP
jgi:hypothetical protein